MYGNKQLVHYGIQNWVENCDLMFHVAVVTKRVFRYEPKRAEKAMLSGKFLQVPVKTGNIVTAKGYIIPPSAIEGCIGIVIPHPIFHRASFNKTDNTTAKGKKAEQVVYEMIRGGYLSLNLSVITVTDVGLQLDGLDLIPRQAENPQVKCDWKAGPRELGGTGNLFIQTDECNPLKLH